MNISMNYKLLEYDRIDISKEIDVIFVSWKECDICHYWYFLSKGFKYEPYLCNCCYDLIQKAMNLNGATLFVSKVVVIVHFWYERKDDAINKINNSDLNDKNGLV